MFAEPLSGWRMATARGQRTKLDWAQEVAALLDGRYAACEKVTLVCDNLNTHTQRGVDWQMKIDDARGKLKSVYPKILL